jgi:hypothetical protein
MSPRNKSAKPGKRGKRGLTKAVKDDKVKSTKEKPMATQEIQIRKPFGAITLPDNEQWEQRFQIRSESSNRLYTIARNKKTGKWGCSCPAYLTRRKCKHLVDGCGLTTGQIHGYGSITSGPGAKESLKG